MPGAKGMRDLDDLISLLARLHLTHDEMAGLHLPLSGAALLPDAVRFGWLKECGLVSSLECPFCDSAHTVQVITAEHGYRLNCPRHRSTVLSRRDVTRYVPSMQSLVSSLQAGLGRRAGQIETHAGGRLFDLGFVDAADDVPDWSALFGVGLDQDVFLQAALEAIAQRLRKGPGLLISADPLPLSLPLPKHYRLTRPSDVWAVTDGGVRIRADAVAECLGLKTKRSTGAGRRNRLEDVRRAIGVIRHTHAWTEIPEDQRRLLEKYWPEDLGPVPGRSTLLEKLGELARETQTGVRESGNPD